MTTASKSYVSRSPEAEVFLGKVLHEIRRMEAGIEQWVHGGRINAVAFEVESSK